MNGVGVAAQHRTKGVPSATAPTPNVGFFIIVVLFITATNTIILSILECKNTLFS